MTRPGLVTEIITVPWIACLFYYDLIRPGIYIIGGAEEDRTPDLRIANATLSQLSYGPVKSLEYQAYNKL